MADSDFDMILKREAKTSLQVFRDQSLLRRKFGDEAVKLYNSLGSGKTASQLMEELHLPEEKFIEILEFLNNNAMVSVVPSAAPKIPVPPSIVPSEKEEGWEIPRPKKDEDEESGSGSKASAASKEDADFEEEPAPSEEGKKHPPIPQVPSRQKPKPEPPPMSPLEKILYDKYGELGVRIYNLIDGEKTAEEILKETGVSEARLVEILEFMDEQGIIKLEKPPEKEEQPAPAAAFAGAKAESQESEPSEEEGNEKPEPAQEPRFKPMIEEEPEAKPFTPPPAPKIEKKEDKEKKIKEEMEEEEKDIILVDVPSLARLSVMQKAVLFAELSTKFGKGARQLLDLVDGARDFIDLSLATGMSFFDIDAIMAYFGKKGMLTFRQLGREEIKKKYGEDGFAIYKRFGRDGLLLYEMIGKEASLKDIIVKSRIEADRAIDILVFIHKVLGLDVPIDRDVIYKQLGMKK